ncbi:MAG TPA: MEDS domain-containing protein [Gemmatimonadaceae bacterium]
MYETRRRSDPHGRMEPIRFAGSVLEAKRHLCAFFDSPDQEYRALLPFIKEGLERGEKAYHVVSPHARDDHLTRLAAAGIDVGSVLKSRQLELFDWHQVYLPDGRFDIDRMLQTWQRALDRAEAEGFPLTRVVAHMEWVLEERAGVPDLLEYEARFNLVGTRGNPVICTYDTSKFSADVVIDVLRTHPMVIIGGTVQENPFFISPEEFIREQRMRRARNR